MYVCHRIHPSTNKSPLKLDESPSKALRSAARDVSDVATAVAREVADDALALVETDTNTLIRPFRDVTAEVQKHLGPVIRHSETHWRNARDVSYAIVTG